MGNKLRKTRLQIGIKFHYFLISISPPGWAPTPASTASNPSATSTRRKSARSSSASKAVASRRKTCARSSAFLQHGLRGGQSGQALVAGMDERVSQPLMLAATKRLASAFQFFVRISEEVPMTNDKTVRTPSPAPWGQPEFVVGESSSWREHARGLPMTRQ